MDLNFILQHAAGNLYWKDKEGRYLGANQAFIKLAGLNQISDLVGKTDRDLFASVMSSEKLSLLEETDRRIMTSGIEESLKEEGIDANGCPAFYMTKKIPIRDEKGEVIGLMGTSLDITKELQADIARTEFLENMRHDIRTPLTGIVGFADIIKIEANSPQLREYADNLVASSHALLHLLDEVLEAIRVSSGEIPKLKKKFNLEKSLQNVIELNRAKAAQKKLTLSLDVDAAIPTYVLGDKVRFHRIALELIANALNFTDIGFVKLSVKLAKRHHRELILKLVVKDSGIGIPKEKQQEIYVQFKRLTPSYQGIYKGAGLGLSVIKQFIDDLDGEIYVESEPKKGTRFTCVIPLQEPLLDDDLGIDEDMEKAIDHPYEMTYTEQIKPTISKAAARSFQVLVVEDNVIAQTVAKSILAQLDCDTDIAETGKKAVELWKQGHYDLMFMDIGLPDIDGYEVTRLIRVQELAKNTHVPIIALTAHAGDEIKNAALMQA
ncbi:PAS domain S-box [Legionella oakridgensis ATCC 33761 = DSM 21215]|uniref:histidine kinase n=1 Tax=Legionella oakridgensis ATCC 33761 = DSM 21215 TaxID=1268635 RepID=W0BGU2_9GAMM|nr:ATP-binding protein [Legionella oakridgensis]AHE67926.1 PAS domain S-box [Legionella oakridgensis ATCC 33761 = DSM 21215]